MSSPHLNHDNGRKCCKQCDATLHQKSAATCQKVGRPEHVALLTCVIPADGRTSTVQTVIQLSKLMCGQACPHNLTSCATLIHFLWHQHVYLEPSHIMSGPKTCQLLCHLPEFWSSDTWSFGPVTGFGPVTPDGQTDRQKAMHMSPPCICTGVLKGVLKYMFLELY